MNLHMYVDCPRCGKRWEASQGESEIDCNCHLYCEDGEKPSDCTLTTFTLNHEVGAPYGAHVGSSTNDDDPMHIQFYCSTHNKYGYKTPISIPVNWDGKRAPRKHRWMNQK